MRLLGGGGDGTLLRGVTRGPADVNRSRAQPPKHRAGEGEGDGDGGISGRTLEAAARLVCNGRRRGEAGPLVAGSWTTSHAQEARDTWRPR